MQFFYFVEVIKLTFRLFLWQNVCYAGVIYLDGSWTVAFTSFQVDVEAQLIDENMLVESSNMGRNVE